MIEKITTHQSEEDSRNKNILIYVDGKIIPREKATISVYDSGFMLGDGVWEGLRLFNGKWIFLEEHLERLFEAALAIDLDICLDKNGVKGILEETRAANNMHTDAHARLMITRGKKVKPFQHPSLSKSGPTIVIIMEHSKAVSSRPIRLSTVPHVRGLPMTQDPKLKLRQRQLSRQLCMQVHSLILSENLILDLVSLADPAHEVPLKV